MKPFRMVQHEYNEYRAWFKSTGRAVKLLTHKLRVLAGKQSTSQLKKRKLSQTCHYGNVKVENYFLAVV